MAGTFAHAMTPSRGCGQAYEFPIPQDRFVMQHEGRVGAFYSKIY